MYNVGTFPDLLVKKYGISEDFHESKILRTVTKLNTSLEFCMLSERVE